MVQELAAFAEMTARPLKKGDNFSVDTQPARRTSHDIERVRAIGADDLDGVGSGARLAGRGSQVRQAAQGFRRGLRARRDAAAGARRARRSVQRLERFREDANADLAALLREEMRDCLPATSGASWRRERWTSWIC